MSRKDNKVVSNFEPTLTKQSFKDECNINNIVAKYMRTGQCTHLNSHKPRYIDCVGVADYQDALAIVAAAQREFDALPAKVRARFANDPCAMVAFVDDPKNLDDAVKLGLLDPKNASEAALEQAQSPTS